MKFILDEAEINLYNKSAIYFYKPSLLSHPKNLLNMAKIEAQNSFIFYAVDVEFFSGYIKRYELINLPTFIIFDNYKEIRRFSNILKFSDFEKYFME